MSDAPRDRPHFHLEGGGRSERYTSPAKGGSGLPPARIRALHARKLEHALGLGLPRFGGHR